MVATPDNPFLRKAIFDISEEGGVDHVGIEHAPVDYGSELKESPGGIIAFLRGELLSGRLGNRILDFGSGVRKSDQVGRALAGWAEQYNQDTDRLGRDRKKFDDVKVGLVDFRLSDEKESDGIFTLNLDLLAVGENGPEVTRAVKAAADFMGIKDLGEPPSDVKGFKKWIESLKQVDSMIFSDVLNYVDYKQLLSLVYLFLKDDGRFYLFNRSNFGMSNLFSEKRPQSTEELESFLTEELKMKILDSSHFFNFSGYKSSGVIKQEKDLPASLFGLSFRDCVVAQKQKDLLENK